MSDDAMKKALASGAEITPDQMEKFFERQLDAAGPVGRGRSSGGTQRVSAVGETAVSLPIAGSR